MQNWFRLMVVGLAVGLPCALVAQERRAFERGGPENLVRTGSMTQTKTVEVEVVKNFSFTVDARGKLVNAGGEKAKETRTVPIYAVDLYIDEQGARDALQPFKGQEKYALLREEKIQNALVEAACPKLLVLRFSEAKKGRELREDLSTELRKHYSGSASEMGKFVSFFRKDLKAGDEAIIRIAEGQRIMTSVQGQKEELLENPELAKALLKMWMKESLVRGVDPLLPKP